MSLWMSNTLAVVRPRSGVDELNVDPHPVSGALHPGHKHGVDAQLGGDLGNGQRRAAVLEHGRAGNGPQRGDARQVGKQVVVDAGRKRRRLLVAGQVGKRQHRDRRAAAGPAASRWRPYPVSDKKRECRAQDDDDDIVDRSSPVRGASRATAVATQAVRREFEGPGQDDCDR
jgi:hypothetical protein